MLDELEREAGSPYAENSAHYSADQIADYLEGAAGDVRNFIRRYFEQSGAIESAERAVTAFCGSPTTGSQAALLKAAKVLEGHNIPMPVRLARTFHPFIRRPEVFQLAPRNDSLCTGDSGQSVRDQVGADVGER
ncbi:hypothetical protein [Bosea sp. NPDC055594]